MIGSNLYAYCANNPVNFSDPTGEFLLTAIVVGAVAGAIIGGTVSYNSGRSSGLDGADLFWSTVAGAGKGALIGAAAGGIVGVTGSAIAAYGATSNAATATISGAATIAAKAVEVGVLQGRKSANDGDNGWQIANDCIDSVFSNGGKIISPALTKSGVTYGIYATKHLPKHKIVNYGFGDYLSRKDIPILSCAFVAFSWGETIYSIMCSDPIARANQRGLVLK